MTPKITQQIFLITTGIQALFQAYIISTAVYGYFTELALVIVALAYSISLVPYLISLLMLKNALLFPDGKKRYYAKSWISFPFFILINLLIMAFEIHQLIDPI